MRKTYKKILSIFLCTIFLISNLSFVSAQTENADGKIKNIIYMIPDGAGMASFFLADYVKIDGGFNKEIYPNLTPVEQGEMYIKDYLVGAETTYSASHSTTDSAAGGTALAGGYKTINGTIGIDPDCKPHATLLEACQLKGMTTGVVATHAWPDATPAAFTSHAESRTDFSDIGTQQAYQDLDLLIACDASSYSKLEWFQDPFLQDRGYTVINTKEELQGIKAGDKIAGKIPKLYYEVDEDRPADTPNLAEVTEAAIRAVDDGNENGFFLMIEGSAIDGGGHDSSTIKLASEWLSFDAACKVAIEYAKKRDDTVVMILTDHDTGGLTITKGDYTRESLETIVDDVKNGIEPENIPWEGWITADANKRRSHTNRDGGVFMYLPEGVSYPEGIDISKKDSVLSTFEDNFKICEVNRIDNTHVAPYLAGLVDVDLNEATKKLFVDTTDYGSYDASSGTFTLTTADGIVATAKKNTSFATVDGKTVDLDGQVCVYVGERFYAPQILFDNIKVKDEFISIHADYSTKTVSVEGVTQKGLADIAIVVTQPNKTIDGSVGADGFASFPYISQMKSSPWKEYNLEFKVADGEVGDYTYYTRINNATDIKEYSFSFKDMAILKGDERVEDISEVKKGDTLKLVLSGFDSSYDGIAGIAQYDQYGNFLGTTSHNIKGDAVKYGDSTSFEATVLDNVDTIKAFYWEKNSLAPFIGTYVIE